MLLPKLIVQVVWISFTCFSKKSEQPSPPTLTMIIIDGFRDLYGCKLLDVAYNALQWQLFVPANYQMNMIAHNTISTNFQSFVLLTIPYAVKENVSVLLSCENIKPGNNGERYKIQLVLIADLVFAAHG